MLKQKIILCSRTDFSPFNHTVERAKVRSTEKLMLFEYSSKK